MKKVLITVAALVGSVSMFSQHQQIRNGDFENWENTGLATEQPKFWSSYKTASGSLVGTVGGMIPQTIGESVGTHDGTGKCVAIWATEVLTYVFNGILTTGQVNLGSTTFTDPANHTVTRTTIDSLGAPLTMVPDSISFWARFACSDVNQYAGMSAVIHTNNEYQIPGGDPSQIVATAVDSFKTCGWTKFTVPFGKVPGNTPAFILITFTTNTVAGAGSGTDTLLVDDVELIYNDYPLASIAVDGISISNFDSTIMEYAIQLDSCTFPVVSATANDISIIPAITQATPATKTATIDVTIGLNTVRYSVVFTTPHGSIDTLYDATGAAHTDSLQSINGCDSITVHLPDYRLVSLELDGTSIPNFAPTTKEYTIALDSCTFPVVTATASVTPTITQATDTTKTATIVVTLGTDSATYTVIFKTTPIIDTLYDATGAAYADTVIGGCDKITVHLPIVGITGYTMDQNNVSLYPNPAANFIDVSSSSVIRDIELYDLVGRLVKKETNVGNTKTRIKLDSLTSGVYSVRVVTEKGVVTKKMILQ
jgi:hypothetical protein